MEGMPRMQVHEEEPEDSQNLRRAFAQAGAEVVEDGEKHISAINLLPFRELQPQTLAEIQDLADRTRDYLALPLVTDRFESHAERRQWRDKLVVDMGLATAQYFRDNRLSLKKMQPVVYRASTLLARLKRESSPAAEPLRASIEAVLEPLLPIQNFAFNYMAMSDAEKVQLTRAFSARIRAYLDLVTRFGAEEQRAAA